MIGALLMAQFSQNTTQLYVIISFSVTMLGNAMIMTPMTTQALNALPRQYIAHGTAMNNTIRQVSAAIGYWYLGHIDDRIRKNLFIKW